MKRTLLLFTILLSSISGKLIAQTSKQNKPSVQERIINIDFSKTAGPLNTFFKECVGAGRANEGLRADWQQQLAQVQKEIGINYIRFHGLLHDDMRVYTLDKEGKVLYNWQYIDKLFDYLLSI